MVLPYNIGDVMTKKCYKCKEVKEITEFYKKSSNTTDKLSGRCKECDNILKANWRSKNLIKARAYEKARTWDKNGRKRKLDNKRNKKNRLEMSDSYMRELITKKSNLNPKDLSDEMIEVHRMNLKIKRALKLTPKLKGEEDQP